jgi:hypothetical protein
MDTVGHIGFTPLCTIKPAIQKLRHRLHCHFATLGRFVILAVVHDHQQVVAIL